MKKGCRGSDNHGSIVIFATADFMDGRGSGCHVITRAIGHAHYPRALSSEDAVRPVHAVWKA